VISFAKLSATTMIILGGSLVGIIAGWELAPLTLELRATHLATVCGVGGALFALSGVCFASECAEARAANQRQIARLTRLNLLIAQSFVVDRQKRRTPPTNAR
jgi:hypothetical protein